MRDYLSLVRTPGAAWPLGANFLALLPVAMIPLGIVLLVQQVSGSYADAGLVTGAYTLAVAVCTPRWGKAIDRLGQTRVLAPLVCCARCHLWGSRVRFPPVFPPGWR